MSHILDLKDCILCPRNCHANRAGGQKGYCGQTSEIAAARAALHMWEEPCISGRAGSGTVFFSGCNMGCIFCQNHPISKSMAGKKISPQRLEEIFFRLQEQKACNINLVTPTHFIPQIRQALQSAKSNGLTIPIVYNTSSYEKVEALKTLEGLIDIYLPDLKYFSPILSKKYSFAEDYFTHASATIKEMVRQTGKPLFIPQELPSSKASGEASNENRENDDYFGPLMKKGVIVRHLVLPGCIEDSKKVLQYLYSTYKNDIYVSIMNQYTPIPDFLDIHTYPELNRPVSAKEYDTIVDYAISLGIENGFIQDDSAASESFIPAFDCYGI
ncbi:4Fe-4S cluster-binding domain-containing protein [Lachnospiraceae bacterium]|nr:4Fe-4S cluster-binding domain-containing protein [Lachnospiraceae bacterium]